MKNNEKTMDMIPVSESAAIIDNLTNSSSEMYMSFKVETPEEKVKLYNALAGESATIKSYVNKSINVADVIVAPVEIVNEDGTKDTVPRVTLIDTNGATYTATSWGVFNCIKRMQAIFGNLHFEGGLKVTPREVKTKNGFTISLQIDG